MTGSLSTGCFAPGLPAFFYPHLQPCARVTGKNSLQVSEKMVKLEREEER